MIPVIVILFVFASIFLIEIFHDDIHRLIRNKCRFFIKKCSGIYEAQEDLVQDDDWSDQWHLLDWISWLLISLVITFLLIWFTGDHLYLAILTMIGSLRALMLNIGGNILSERPFLYLGSGWWDSKFKGKEIIYYIGLLIILISSICIRQIFSIFMS